jgi:3-dehydrosphinganine reductase
MSSKLHKAFYGKTAIITGGSQGIGKAVAVALGKHGASICIVARNKKNLSAAEHEISKYIRKEAYVESISADAADFKLMNKNIQAFVKKHGTPDYLFNFAGYAYPQYIQKLTFDDFSKNMETNYYAQLAPSIAMLPHFMEKKQGHIINCSSVAGFMGMMGYATYSPTKFAIAGLTESLRHECSAAGVKFSVAYPPDTDTPGFEHESITKPREVAILSEGGGLLSADEVAEKILNGVAKNRFFILPGQSKLLWTINRFFPNLTHKILDMELAKAVKKVGLSNK